MVFSTPSGWESCLLYTSGPAGGQVHRGWREPQSPPQGGEEHNAQDNGSQHQGGQEQSPELPQRLQQGEQAHRDEIDHGVEQDILPDPAGAQGHVAQYQADGNGVKQLIQVTVEQTEAQSRGCLLYTSPGTAPCPQCAEAKDCRRSRRPGYS